MITSVQTVQHDQRNNLAVIQRKTGIIFRDFHRVFNFHYQILYWHGTELAPGYPAIIGTRVKRESFLKKYTKPRKT